MSTQVTGQARVVIPTDDTKIEKFGYITAGNVGAIAVKRGGGDVVTIPSTVVSRMPIIPVGQMDEVLATGTTATDIVVW